MTRAADEPDAAPDSTGRSWPFASGEMARRVREHDWSQTALGALESWPQSLRTAVQVTLASPFPHVLLWGPDLLQIYNDGYRDLMGDKHPAGLGQPTRDCWPEVWHANEPIYQRVFAGESVAFKDALCPITRSGALEDAWFTLAYSPIREESGDVAGVLVAVCETTERLRAMRALRRSEDALRASEERFRALVEPFAQAVWETDADGMVVEDSLSWRAYTGQTLSEWLGEGWADAVHPEDRAYALRQWREGVRDVRIVDVEFRLRSLDGGWRWTNARAAPLRNPDGSVLKWVGMNVDITERRTAEDALRQSETRLRILADAIPQIIWTNRGDGRATYFNSRWYEYTGLSYEQSAGPGWQGIVHPEDAAASLKRWQRALSAETAFDAEYRLLRHDGVYCWFLGRNVPLKDAHGRVISWFGTATDIDNLKHAEAALRESADALKASEERFRLLVEGARDYAMFLLDGQSTITFWSVGAERLFGYTEAEALGRNGDLIFTPEEREQGEPAREREMARTMGRVVDRRWHQRRDGSRFWADGLLMRLNDAAGNLRGFAKVTRDATEQRRNEEAIEHALQAVADANRTLEMRVRERTADLARMSELRQELLRRLVTAQEEERGRISRDLHDDTGQQLTALLLGLSNLKDSAAFASAPRSRELLSQLQDLAGEVAKKSHRLSFTLRPTALDDQGLMGALQNYVEEWGRWSGLPVDLESVGLGGGRRLPAEMETTIYRVVQEALTNVLKHAVAANGACTATRVDILVQRHEDEVLTIIEDNGPGFDVEAALNQLPGRLHLGIFDMQERARLASGTLIIESEPGKGTAVYLRLPLYRS